MAHRRKKTPQDEGPWRTGVGCRCQKNPEEMLRWVQFPEEDGTTTLALDLYGRVPGRGAWICPEVPCVQRALRKGGFQRSFRTKIHLPDEHSMVAQMRSGLTRLLREKLALTRRAGALDAGETKVYKAFKQDLGGLLLLATDLSDSSRSKHLRQATRKGVTTIEAMTGQWLGGCIGCSFAGIILVHREPFVRDIARLCDMLRRLHESDTQPPEVNAAPARARDPATEVT